MSSAPLPSVANPASGLLHSYASIATPALGHPGRRRPLSGMFPLTFLCTTSLLAETPPWGFFSGAPKFEVFDDGRKLRLLDDFSYTDPQGRTWMASARSIVQPALVSRVFRSFTGHPLEERSRNASIIHALACDQKTAAWPDVHRTFYHALRCGGVTEIKAKLLYYAAYHFGPRWGFATGLAEVFSAVGLGNENMRQLVDQKNAAAIIAWIERTNPSLEELQGTKPTSAKITAAR